VPGKCREVFGFAIDPEAITAAPVLKFSDPIDQLRQSHSDNEKEERC